MMPFKWLSDNQTKENIGQYHLLVNNNDKIVINLGQAETENSENEKLLRIKVDVKLNFKKHLNDIISKPIHKVIALSRNVARMGLSKKRILMNPFFNLQLSYCPFIWMFYSPTKNNKINRLHERWMRLIYEDKT